MDVYVQDRTCHGELPLLACPPYLSVDGIYFAVVTFTTPRDFYYLLLNFIR